MREFLAFEEARAYVRNLYLDDFAEWKRWAASHERPLFIPCAPERVYKGRFKGFGNWLGNYSKRRRRGKKSQFLSFTEARSYVRSLGLKSVDEWWKWASSGKRPLNIPCNPRTYYKEEFQGFKDWLNG